MISIHFKKLDFAFDVSLWMSFFHIDYIKSQVSKLIIIYRHMSQNISDIYKEQIRAWSETLSKGINPIQYFDRFIYTIKGKTGICISFDNSIAEIILAFLKSTAFQVFKEGLEHANANKRRCLFLIADVLYQMGFIGRQQHHQISMEKDIFVFNKLSLFLDFCKQIGSDPDQIEDTWNSVIDVNMPTFWMQMEEEGIKDNILLDVYDKVCKCSPLINDRFTKDFVNRLKNPLDDISLSTNQSKIIAVPVTSKKRLVDVVPQIREKPVDRSFMRENYKMENSRIYEKVWFNASKYEAYEETIQKKRRSKSKIQILLTELAYEQAMFFNPKHKKLIQSIFSFIQELRSILDNNQVASYQTFGSIRSTLALTCQFDIDLTTIRDVSLRGAQRKYERKDDVNLLFAVKKTLQKSSPAWVESSIVFKFEKLKVPFLKIKTKGAQLERLFQLRGIEKLDITVGNKTAIKNSDLISLFAQQPEITLFCILVKLWAKNNDVINTKNPMQGFSSYAVIMMCLYYLMETKQINFLRLSGQYDIDNTKLQPNFEVLEILDLEQNFKGFLEFYKQTGVFQRQKKIVCLLQNCSKGSELYDEEILVNICDFIDGSNPGRLKYSDKDPIYEQFQRAIRIMNNRGADSIRQLFTTK